ncbi:MAG TPA: HPr family phosphocarrier protein [Gammaproteobacteria bacterium]|nr:HPr family phosphocarrier protein [Gammaproteobacteria bacterium]
MISEKIFIINRLGLHARAAAKLVATAGRYQANISVVCKGKTANAKSIMAIMMLAASQNTEVELRAEGEDEKQALSAMIELIQDKFGEEA